jgi:hypothetical protein
MVKYVNAKKLKQTELKKPKKKHKTVTDTNGYRQKL